MPDSSDSDSIEDNCREDSNTEESRTSRPAAPRRVHTDPRFALVEFDENEEGVKTTFIGKLGALVANFKHRQEGTRTKIKWDSRAPPCYGTILRISKDQTELLEIENEINKDTTTSGSSQSVAAKSVARNVHGNDATKSGSTSNAAKRNEKEVTTKKKNDSDSINHGSDVWELLAHRDKRASKSKHTRSSGDLPESSATNASPVPKLITSGATTSKDFHPELGVLKELIEGSGVMISKTFLNTSVEKAIKEAEHNLHNSNKTPAQRLLYSLIQELYSKKYNRCVSGFSATGRVAVSSDPKVNQAIKLFIGKQKIEGKYDITDKYFNSSFGQWRNNQRSAEQRRNKVGRFKEGHVVKKRKQKSDGFEREQQGFLTIEDILQSSETDGSSSQGEDNLTTKVAEFASFAASFDCNNPNVARLSRQLAFELSKSTRQLSRCPPLGPSTVPSSIGLREEINSDPNDSKKSEHAQDQEKNAETDENSFNTGRNCTSTDMQGRKLRRGEFPSVLKKTPQGKDNASSLQRIQKDPDLAEMYHMESNASFYHNMDALSNNTCNKSQVHELSSTLTSEQGFLTSSLRALDNMDWCDA